MASRNIKLAEKIKELRELTGKNQTDFAEQIMDVTQPSISLWESTDKERIPPRSKIIKYIELAKKYNYPLSYEDFYGTDND